MGVESPLLLPLVLIACIVGFALYLRGGYALVHVIGPLYGPIGRLLRFTALRYLLLAVAGLAILLVPSNPYYVGKDKTAFAVDMDIIIVNDDSQSMAAEVGGETRLERGQLIARDLVLELAGADIAICEFTNRMFCRAPFGSSNRTVLRTIKNFDIEAIGGSGSEIRSALNKLPKEFSENGARARVIFLISDGGERLAYEGYRRELDAVLEHFADNGIVVMTIGVGENYPVPIGLKPVGSRYYGDYETTIIDGQKYEIVTTQLNEAKLRHMAAKTGGVYMHESEFREQGADVAVPSALKKAGILKPTTRSLGWVAALVALVCCWLYMLFFRPSLR